MTLLKRKVTGMNYGCQYQVVFIITRKNPMSTNINELADFFIRLSDDFIDFF